MACAANASASVSASTGLTPPVTEHALCSARPCVQRFRRSAAAGLASVVVGVRYLTIAVLAVGAATGGLTATPSRACACDPSAGSITVAQGRSHGGQRWRQRALYVNGLYQVDLSLPDASGDDNGGGTQFPGFVRGFRFTMGSGSGFPAPDRGEVDGAADVRVRRIDVRMSDGSVLVVLPRLAPRSLRHDHPFLRSIRLFVVFFAGDREPRVAVARDANGRVLQRQRSDQGAFEPDPAHPGI
jgi:hypothetical protein